MSYTIPINIIDYSVLSNRLSIDPDIDNDIQMQNVIDSVFAAFESYTRRELGQKVRTHSVFPLYAKKFFQLKALPIASVYSVTVDSNVVTDFSVADYGLFLSSEVEKQPVSITYTGGFIEATDDLKRAAMIQVQFEYSNRSDSWASSVSNEFNQLARPQIQLLDVVTDVLNFYKLVQI